MHHVFFCETAADIVLLIDMFIMVLLVPGCFMSLSTILVVD
jgi:hypothetical protein